MKCLQIQRVISMRKTCGVNIEVETVFQSFKEEHDAKRNRDKMRELRNKKELE